jgi:predicted metalloprotease with PDZ domain
MYAFHLTVPQGVSSLEVKCDFLATAAATGFSAGASTSANLAMLSWNEVMLYPAGHQSADISVEPAVTLPAGWQYGTALTKTSQDGGTIHFETVSLEQLVDSPLLTGKYFQEFPLAPEITPKHYLDIAADGPEDLRLRGDALEAYSNLIRETGALYQSRHYTSYHFLVTASDQVAHFGLEHHQSSDDRVPEKTFVDDNLLLLSADLLPHEFTHSWNGKFRRPADLWTPNYNVPMQDSLLWVYEGQTQYWGQVLAARSGLRTRQQALDQFAITAAHYEVQKGRQWRPLQDTTNDEIINPRRPQSWLDWQRFEDYYDEAALIWLDADTWIREHSKGARSLDDFARAFFGIDDGSFAVVTYNFDDIVKALNAVEPNDWAGFLRERLDAIGKPVPEGGFHHGGYKLVYTDKPSDYQAATEEQHKRIDLLNSIGIEIDAKDSKECTLTQVIWGSPAFKAKLTEGAQILAINGIAYDTDVLKDAIRAAHGTQAPIQLIFKIGDRYMVANVDYHDGLRYPHLERETAEPARLDEILTARP